MNATAPWRGAVATRRRAVTRRPRERREFDDKGGIMYKRVLVPVDGSGVAESILPFIREIAGPSDLDVILLQVDGFIPPMAIEGTRYFASMTSRRGARRRKCISTFLARSCETLGSAFIRASGAGSRWTRSWRLRRTNTWI
jgi:hypothetical protein